MKNLEKLLNAFTMGLFVWNKPTESKAGSMVVGSYTHADEATKDCFKERMRSSIQNILKGEEEGSKVLTYNFYVGRVRRNSTIKEYDIVTSFNPQLEEVVRGLPELKEGQAYLFPASTFLTLQVRTSHEGDIEIEVTNACEWLAVLLENQ